MIKYAYKGVRYISSEYSSQRSSKSFTRLLANGREDSGLMDEKD